MKEVYAFYGDESFLIDEEIKKIIEKHPNSEVIKYDLEESSLNLLLEDALSLSLFNEHKIIIGSNANFLSASDTKGKVNQNVEDLLKYIDNPNDTSTIIFTLSTNIDKRKKIVKQLLSKSIVKECNKLTVDNAVLFAKDIFSKANFQVGYSALNKLVHKTGNNLYLLNSECNKLMIYKNEEKKIELDDVDQMVERYDIDNLFALTDAVVKKDINEALSLYQELLKRNEEPIKIIVIIANQFRLIFQVKRLKSKGLSDSEIASELAVHPYRVKLAKETNLSEKELLKYLTTLADLDEQIKTGKINKDVGLELFLLKL
ncbi:MAG TPA: DNA polymerase III subunit delta [Mollicutes bacterium]|nr:DNA polymerase III subunit delta [Mollicutes bacterium]